MFDREKKIPEPNVGKDGIATFGSGVPGRCGEASDTFLLLSALFGLSHDIEGSGMIRLLITTTLIFLVLFAHLRKDRRKGSHRQSKHGNRYRSEGGKRILAKAGGSGTKKTSRSDKGRKIAGFAGAKSGKKKPAKDDDDSWLIDDAFDDDDDDEPKSKEDREREKYEASVLREMEYNERGRLHDIILNEYGGIKTPDSLREEYRQIPNNVKRRDGFTGDDVAAMIANDYPEFGIESERDLIDFYANDYRAA